jgi:hypothetical protein
VGGGRGMETEGGRGRRRGDRGGGDQWRGNKDDVLALGLVEGMGM